MNVFEQEICKLSAEALNAFNESEKWVPSELYKLVEQPPNTEMGDYALPCFSFAKILKIPPVKVAEKLSVKLKNNINSNNYIISVEAIGSYINFNISELAMAEAVLPEIFSGRYFKEPSKNSLKRVMIEYSQPNTHKGFHVGHLRNVALGDSLIRIFKYNGHNVVGVNYIGDVGALNQIIHIWQFEDDNARRELWKIIYEDKDFIKFATEFRPLVLTQENKLMTAAPWTPYQTN